MLKNIIFGVKVATNDDFCHRTVDRKHFAWAQKKDWDGGTLKSLGYLYNIAFCLSRRPDH